MKKIGIFLLFYFVFNSFCLAEDAPVFFEEEVIVTASRRPQLKERSPWNTTVLLREDIEAGGARNVGEVLRTVAGADVKGSGFEGSLTTVRLRGCSAEQLLVLVDGMRVSSTLLGQKDLTDILIDDVERIEIVRGASSAVYGSDAVGGVINVITKKPSKTKSDIKLSYGTFNSSNILLQTRATGEVSYAFSGSYLRSDGFRENSALEAAGLNAAWKWELLNDDEMALSGGYYTARKGIPGIPSREADPYSALTPHDLQADRNADLEIAYSRDLEDGGNVELKAYQVQADQAAHWFDFWDKKDFVDSAYYSLTNALELKHLFFLSEKDRFGWGVDWREDLGRSASAGEHSVNNIALWLQDESDLSENLFLNLGGRADRHSRSGDFTSFRSGILYKLHEELDLRISYGTSFHSPTLNQLFWDSSFYKGSRDLAPEKGQTIDIQVEQRFNRASKLSFGYFANTLSDMIVANFDPTLGVYRAANIDSAVIQGIETEFASDLSDILRYSANFTIQNPVRMRDLNVPTSVGKDLPYTPRVKGNIVVGLGPSGDLNFDFLGRYVGEQFIDAQNTQGLPDHFVLDSRLSGVFDGGSWELILENLLDVVYYETAGNLPGPPYSTIKYPMPGLAATFGIRYDI